MAHIPSTHHRVNFICCFIFHYVKLMSVLFCLSVLCIHILYISSCLCSANQNVRFSTSRNKSLHRCQTRKTVNKVFLQDPDFYLGHQPAPINYLIYYFTIMHLCFKIIIWFKIKCQHNSAKCLLYFLQRLKYGIHA